jgi:WD40 repeat protein
LYFKGGSPEGQHEDRSVRVWDVSTGRQLQVLSGHALAVMALAYSQDGGSLTSVSSDTINVWNTSSSSPANTIAVYPPPKITLGSTLGLSWKTVVPVVPNNSEDPYQKMWKSYFEESALDAVISPTGNAVAMALPGKKFRLFAPAQNRELKSLDVEAQLEVQSPIAFRPDGQAIAYIKKGNKVIMQTVGTGLQIWQVSVQDPVTLLCFSPDGNSLLLETTLNNSRTLHLMAASDGHQVRQVEIFNNHVSRDIAFSPDARLVAMVAKGEHVVELRETSTGNLVRVLKTALAPDLEGSQTHSARDPALSRELSAVGITLPGELMEAEEDVGDFSSTYRFGASILFTPDRKWLLWKTGRSSTPAATLWDSANGMQVPDRLNPRFREIGNPNQSPDGRFRVEPQYEAQTHSNLRSGLGLGSKGGDELAQRVKLLDAHSSRKLHTLEAGSAVEVGLVPTIGFSPDGSRIAVRGVKITRTSLRTAKVHWNIYVFDTASGTKVSQIETPNFDEETGLPISPQFAGFKGLNEFRRVALPQALAVSQNGAVVAVGYSSKIVLFDSSAGNLLRDIPHSGGIVALSFSPDGNLLAALGEDGDAYIFDARAGRLLAILISISAVTGEQGNDEWLVVTPDGKFDGSPPGWSQILWRFGGDTFNVAPVETFFNDFYYPGLLGEVLAGKELRLTRSLAQLDRRQPAVELSVPNAAQPSVDNRTVKVQVRVAEAPADNDRPQGSGVRDVRLFRNGSLVKWWHGNLQLDGAGKAALEVTVPIVAGQNRLTCYAFNHDNIKSANASLLLSGGPTLKRAGTAYIVSVGINEYSNPDYNLKFAVADAHDVSNELKAQQKKLGTVGKVEVIPLLDSQATKQNVLLALQLLTDTTVGPLPEAAPAAMTELRPAQPEDEVFVYFAGHGVAVGPRFYLIPHDLGYWGKRTQLDMSGLQDILTHSISDLELEQALEQIDARDVVLVIDACNSGQALEAEEKRRGPINSKGLAQLAYEKGMFVLTAAQGYQAALEAIELGHGLLTYALVEEGLKTAAADREPKDGKVEVKEWLDYATVRVPELQASYMERAHKLGRDISFVEEPADPGQMKQPGLQRPRVFYRRDTDPEPLVVAKPNE